MRFLTALQSVIAVMLMLTLLCFTAQAQQMSLTTAPASPEATAQAMLAHATKVAIIDRGTVSNWPAQDVNAVPWLIQDLQAWGRYQVVASPADADVVLEFSGATTLRTVYPAGSDTDDAPYTVVVPFLHLGIRDPQSTAPVWTVTVQAVSGSKHGHDLFAMSVQNVVSQIKLLTGVPLTNAETRNVHYIQTQRKHSAIFFAGIATVAVGAAIGGAIIAKDKFDHDKVEDADQQHQFCVVNHIPNC